MRLSAVLKTVPKFYFWKDFGAGRKRIKYPYYKYWHSQWKRKVYNLKILDMRVLPEDLPEGAKIFKAQELMSIELPESNKLQHFNHPWPFNITQDPCNIQEKLYHYNITTRLYKPDKDALAFTNSIMGPALAVPSNPDLDLFDQELELARERYYWATKGDFSLYRLPRRREMPRIDQKPRKKYGITRERAELNVVTTLDDFVGTLLARRFQKSNKTTDRFDHLMNLRNISYPNSNIPLERDGSRINLNLSNDIVKLSNNPLPLMNKVPEVTIEQPAVSINPRSWRSLLEETSRYNGDYKFRLPIDAHLHTLILTARVNRDLNEYEMFARSLIHAYAMTIQGARVHRSGAPFDSDEVLDEMLTSQVNNQDQLEKPICLQTIAYDSQCRSFYFTRFQLNSTNYNSSVKNQAWYSGPITSMKEVMRYWVDFQVYGIQQ